VDRLDPLPAAARERQQRQAGQRIEQPCAGAAAAVDERRLHDRGRQRHRREKVVRPPLADVVLARGAVVGAERGDLDHAPHADFGGRGEQRTRRAHVDRIERHSPGLADQADGVDDGVDAAQARPPLRRFEVAREVDLDRFAAVGGPPVYARDNPMAGGAQGLREMLADEPARSGKEYNHPRLVSSWSCSALCF
jgi:hypothetical protein